MGIRIKLGKDGAVFKRNVAFYPACDHCGEEINAEDPGNCECVEENDALVYFVHVRCSRAFRATKPKMAWANFVSMNLKVK